MIWFRLGCKEQGVHTLHRQHGEDLLIDFVLGKEIKAGLKCRGMGEVGENQIN